MADVTNKTLNVRIKNKYDSYENWVASSVILEAGEIAVAHTMVDSGIKDDKGVDVKHPALLMKVGDGTSTFAQLPWLSAKAADVADWAKAAERPVYKASDIQELGNFIESYVSEDMKIEIDTDTQYKIVADGVNGFKLQSKGKAADAEWADVAGSAFAVDFTAVNNEIQGLKDKVGEKAVGTQIDDKIAELDLGNTYAAKEHTHTKSEITDFAHTHTKSEITDFAHNHEIADVNGLADAIADAKKAGTDANGALEAYKATNDKAVGDNAAAIEAIIKDASIATFKGIEDKIGTVAEGKTVVKMIEDAQAAATYNDEAVRADIQGLKDKVGEKAVGTQIEEKITELKLADTYASKEAYEAYVEANDEAVAANAAAIEKLNGDDKTEGSVKKHVADEIAKIVNENNNGDFDTLNEIAAWIKNDTAGVGALNKSVTDNADAIEAIKDGAALDSFKDVEDKIGALTAATVAAEIAAAKQAAIDEASYDDKAVKEDIQGLKDKVGEKAVGTQIEEKITEFKNGDFATEQGRIDDLEDAVDGLATIAETGNVDDLVQTTGTYIVFDCGTASTII